MLGALVVSHWVLDVIVHRPDLPLAPGTSLRLGLGLWNPIPATLAVEFVLYAVGVWLYWRVTEARDRVGSLGFCAASDSSAHSAPSRASGDCRPPQH